MKNKKGNVVVIVIIIAIVIIAAVFFGWMFVKKTQTPGLQETNNVGVVEKDSSQKIACGSVSQSNAVTSREELTGQEGESLNCANKSFSSCSPASIEFTGSLGASYNIHGINGNSCVVSRKDAQGEKRCTIPLELMAYNKKIRQENKNEDMMFITMQAYFASGTTVKKDTGEVVTIDCINL